MILEKYHGWLISALVLAFCLTLYNASPKSKYTPSTLYELELRGNSMYPTIESGEIIIIDKAFPYRNLKIGDIITYKEKGMIVDWRNSRDNGYVHRIIGIAKGDDKRWRIEYKIKGDGNDYIDPFILTRHNYRGKIINDQKNTGND